ncbi:unnamed protein product [Auanema sp. JU1783]|nr:unnamed protein product [Auanema sp. JU1783]
MSSKKREEEPGSFGYALAKALRPASDWPNKDDLLDVVYWGKQVFALVIGILFGLVPLTGIFAIGLYVVISTMIVQHFVVHYQKVDEDEVGGFWELAKEGFGAAFATYMVSWITVYSSVHHS